MQAIIHAIKSARTVPLTVIAAAGFGFLAVLYCLGITWVSDNVVPYVLTAALITLLICLVILVPISLFRATRLAARYGFFVSALVFGLCAWILGFLTAYEYWGIIGVIVGLVLGIVGVVPVGIFASLLHADWLPAGMQIIGAALSYLAGWYALRLVTLPVNQSKKV